MLRLSIQFGLHAELSFILVATPSHVVFANAVNSRPTMWAITLNDRTHGPESSSSFTVSQSLLWVGSRDYCDQLYFESDYLEYQQVPVKDCNDGDPSKGQAFPRQELLMEM